MFVLHAILITYQTIYPNKRAFHRGVLIKLHYNVVAHIYFLKLLIASSFNNGFNRNEWEFQDIFFPNQTLCDTFSE